MSKLYVRIADTPASQSHGLMFVKDMPRDEGMLFSFSRNQKLSFWGENTYIPLDIAFVDYNGIIREISKIHPLSKRTVSSGTPCKYAVEANDGFFEENNIDIGDKMFINSDDDSPFLTFAKKGRNLFTSQGNAKARYVLSQIMGDNVAYDMEEDFEEEEEAVVPEISSEELWKYLEDNQEDEPLEVAPEEELGAMEAPMETPETEEPEFEYPSFSNAFDAVEWARDNNETMRIAYTTKHGTGIVRDIEPHGKFHAETTGHEILVTYDRSVEDIRAFILQNIGSFSFTGERFEPRFKLV